MAHLPLNDFIPQRGIRNLEAMHTCPADTLSVDALLGHDQIVMTEPALRRAEELWGGQKAGVRRTPAAAASGERE